MTKPARKKPTAPDPLLGQLETALDSSLSHAVWLTPADQVSIAWAKKLAQALDATTDEQTLMRLGKLFETVTRDLGLSISGRDAKVEEPRLEVSPLDQIRKAAGGKSIATDQNEIPETTKPKPRSRSAR